MTKLKTIATKTPAALKSQEVAEATEKFDSAEEIAAAAEEIHEHQAYLILETGEAFSGILHAKNLSSVEENSSLERAGEVVFNTSHSGYEEIATDPSYYSQILVMTAPMQGNYGAHNMFWESNHIWIKAFVCLELEERISEENLFYDRESDQESDQDGDQDNRSDSDQDNQQGQDGQHTQGDRQDHRNQSRRNQSHQTLREISFQKRGKRQDKKGHSKKESLLWKKKLTDYTIPILSHANTRQIVLRLRNQGVAYGAIVKEKNLQKAFKKAQKLISESKNEDLDWPFQVSCKKREILKGEKKNGPKVAILDFGCKKNIVRELKRFCSEIALFPCRSSPEEIKKYNPHGILLSNGPGNPLQVRLAVETVKSLLGWRFIFGICMGHQILGLALGGKTYKLLFGHRGSNHPVKELMSSKIYITSQNHGYAIQKDSLPKDVKITHTNLNDGTIAGIYSEEKKCMGVQFHPESSPGTNDAKYLFHRFIECLS